MSLYDALHGHDANAAPLLSALGLDPEKIERLRDVSFGRDGDAPVVHVLCRTGGGNREYHPNHALTSHPMYLRDHDDEYDCTYAHYYFTIPAEVLADLAARGLTLDDVTDVETLRQKAKRVVEAIGELK